MGHWWKPLLIAGVISLLNAILPTFGFADDGKTCSSPQAPAIAACSRLIASGKFKGRNLAVLYHNRGFAYMTAKDNGRALTDYDTAIRMAPTVEDFWYNRGRTHAANGDPRRAIADYNRAIELKPNLARHYVMRGDSFGTLGEYQRALGDLEHAIRLEPDRHAYGYHVRGAILRRNGAIDAAIASHDQGLRIDPLSVYGYTSRAHALSEKGDQERALRDADEALRLAANAKENASHPFKVRGLIFSRMDNPVRAVADFDESLRLAPNDARALLWRGLAHERTGDTRRASSDFQAVLKETSGLSEDREYARGVARTHLPSIEMGRNQQQQPSSVAAAPPVAAAPQAQGRRVALVVGNSEYRGVPFLPNPRRDAATIADALRRTGFEQVTLVNDLSREKMIEALRKFAADSDGADWSLIYFAGHGIEVGGQNYLIPVDAKLAADRDVQYEAVQLEQVMGATEGAKKLRLLLLDACRENPFANQMRRVVASRSIERGLREVDTDAGMLVVFAAKHGQVAYDGDGGSNSPFVSALARRMLTPQLEIRKLFDLVRDDVMAATGRRQQPFSYGSVPGNEDFYFTR